MIKISLDNREKINAMLAKANGKASAFVISAGDIIKLADEAEAMLADRGVPKALRPGCAYSYTPAGPSASAYKYAAASTHVRLQRRSGDWYLVEARRQDVWPRQKENQVMHITEAARDAMIAHALRDCAVQRAAPQIVSEAA